MPNRVTLTLNRPGFSESGKAGGRGGADSTPIPGVTSLFEDQWP